MEKGDTPTRGQISALVGYSYRQEEDEPEPTIEAAVENAVETGLERGDQASWWEISRVQAEIVGHNQWVRAYKVILTPTES